VPGRKQLEGCRDDSTVHAWRSSKGRASSRVRQAVRTTAHPPEAERD
jgi:hypothetical protein